MIRPPRIKAFACRHHVPRGFTLIEIVVALALLAMVSISLFESLRFGQRTYEKVIRGGGAHWDVFAAQRLVRNLVESAYPEEPSQTGAVRRYGLEGRKDRIVLTAPAPEAVGGAGLFRYEFSLRQNVAAGYDVLVRWWPDYAVDTGSVAASAQEVLIEKIVSLEWSYRAAPALNDSGGGGDAWKNEWLDSQELPALVRLRVKFPDGDSRRWPDLVMAPRVTDDANCVFDIVAQRCRAAS